MPSTTSSSPLSRSRLEIPRQEALTFRSLLIFVLPFLRQLCILVSVLRYYLLPLTCALELLYSSPRGPWLVLNNFFYFFFLSVFCYLSTRPRPLSCRFF